MADLSAAEQADNVETLDNVFDGKTENEEVVQDDEPKDDEEPKGAEQEETPEQKDSAPPAEENDRKSIPIAAYHGVKRENAELKERLERLEKQFQEDEEDSGKSRSEIRKEVEEEMRAERFSASRTKALESFDDYTEREAEFMLLAQRDTSLIEKMNASPDPSRFAYDTAVAVELAKEERLRQKLLAELQSKNPTESEKRKAKAVAMPDLTRATAVSRERASVERETSNPKDDIDSVFG